MGRITFKCAGEDLCGFIQAYRRIEFQGAGT